MSLVSWPVLGSEGQTVSLMVPRNPQSGEGTIKGEEPRGTQKNGEGIDKESSMEEDRRGSLEEVVLLLMWKGG